MTKQPGTTDTLLIAGPPPSNPPPMVAALIVLSSLIAPFLFVRTGAPSLWLTAAIFALAFAGIMTLFGVKNAMLKARADATVRPRAVISSDGIIFLASPSRTKDLTFLAEHIAHAALLDSALLIKTTPHHPNPGRHILRFSRLASPRDELSAAIRALKTTS